MTRLVLVTLLISLQILSNDCAVYNEPTLPIETLEDCDRKSFGDLSRYCKCDLFKINLNKKDLAKIKSEHSVTIVKEFQKNLSKTMYSISNDLNILDTEKESLPNGVISSLNKSCSINRLDKILLKCKTAPNSYASLLNANQVKELRDSFINELSTRQEPHINTGKSCTEKSKGYINRCNSKNRTSCNMSDNIADAVFMDASKKKLTQALMGYVKLQSGSLDKGENFNKQLSSADELGVLVAIENNNFNYSRLSTLVDDLRANPFLSELMQETDSIPFIDTLLARIREIDSNDTENLFDTIYKLVDKEIIESKQSALPGKCDDLYANVEKFYCSNSSDENNHNFYSLPKDNFMQVISSDDHNDTAFGASKYYCEKVTKAPISKVSNPVTPLEEIMYQSEIEHSNVISMTQANFDNQSQKIRGTGKKPMLCKDVYGPVYDKAIAAGFDVDNITDPKEKEKLYRFQINEYEKIYEKICLSDEGNAKDSQKCDFTASLINVTKSKLSEAVKHKKIEIKEKEIAKKENRAYVPRDYSKSLAQRVLLDTPTKVENNAPKKKETSKKKVANIKDTPKEESNNFQAATVTTYKPLVNKASESIETKSPVSNDTSSPSVTSVSTGLSLNHYNSKLDKMNKDIEFAKQEYTKLKNESPQELKRIEKQIEENRENNIEHTPAQIAAADASALQDRSGTPTSSRSIASFVDNDSKPYYPDQFKYNSKDNDTLFDTINKKRTSADQVNVITPEDYLSNTSLTPPSYSPVLNQQFDLFDEDNNITILTKITLKGSVAKDFRNIFKKDKDTSIRNDHKMNTTHLDQKKYFDEIARAIKKEKDILFVTDKVSKKDAEKVEITVIAKRDKENNTYNVKPFAEKDMVKSYPKHYADGVNNISTAFRDKTFQRLVKEYDLPSN